MIKDFVNYPRGAVNFTTLKKLVKIGVKSQDALKDIPRPVDMVIDANLIEKTNCVRVMKIILIIKMSV